MISFSVNIIARKNFLTRILNILLSKIKKEAQTSLTVDKIKTFSIRPDKQPLISIIYPYSSCETSGEIS